MKTINTIKGILLAAILFGLFANFAQNNYGMAIVRLALLALVFLFPIASIIAKKEKKRRKTNTSSSPLFEGIGLMLFALGIFFRLSHYNGASILLLLSSLLILIYLVRLIVKSFLNKDGVPFFKLLSFSIYFLLSLGLLSSLFQIQVYPGQEMFSHLYLLLLSLLFIPLIISYIRYNKSANLIIAFKNIVKGNIAVLLLVFSLFVIYNVSDTVGIQPQIFDDNAPKSLQDMRHQYLWMMPKEGEIMREKYYTYSDTYWNFIKNREKETDQK